MKQNVMGSAAKANGLSILLGLNNTGKHVYSGTAPYATVQKRRAKNRIARKTRRAGR